MAVPQPACLPISYPPHHAAHRLQKQRQQRQQQQHHDNELSAAAADPSTRPPLRTLASPRSFCVSCMRKVYADREALMVHSCGHVTHHGCRSRAPLAPCAAATRRALAGVWGRLTARVQNQYQARDECAAEHEPRHQARKHAHQHQQRQENGTKDVVSGAPVQLGSTIFSSTCCPSCQAGRVLVYWVVDEDRGSQAEPVFATKRRSVDLPLSPNVV